MKGLWGPPILAIGLVLYGCGGSGGSGSGGGGGVAVTPDEKILYTLYNEDDLGDIYISNPDGTMNTPLIQDDEHDDFHPVGSLANDKIYFASNRSGTYQIWEVSDDGTGLRKVTSFDEDAEPVPTSVSPDGKYLLATAKNFMSGNSNGDILKIEIATGEFQVLGSTDAPEFTGRYSPDGSKIVFGRAPNGGSNDLMIMTSSGADVHVLRDTADDEYDASFSPSGNEMIFTLISANQGAVLKMPAGGGTATPVTDLSVNFTMGSYSRDGSKIVVRKQGGLIGTINLGSTAFTPLQTPAGSASEPFWR